MFALFGRQFLFEILEQLLYGHLCTNSDNGTCVNGNFFVTSIKISLSTGFKDSLPTNFKISLCTNF